MNRTPFFLLSLVLIFCQCKKQQESLSLTDLGHLPLHEEAEGYERPCSESVNCAPDEYTIPKTIRVNVHFLDSPEKDATWPLDVGKNYLGKVLSSANSRLGKNQQMFLPVGNETPVLDPGFRYKVVGVKDDDDGFYYHMDSLHYYFINKGKNRNNYNRDVIKKYAISQDSILNIFVISHPQDSLSSKTYKPHGSGVALGTSLKITGLYSNRESPAWSWASLLNHEIGHVLGLAHAWGRNDGCEDTPVHANCWDKNAKRGSTGKPCGEGYSNNVMDYNNQQSAYTPCQLGRIHKNFNLPGSKTRGLLYETWCDLDTSETIYIDSEVQWQCNRDINKNIVIEKGGQLHIHCRLGMAKGAKIKVNTGGQLHLHTYAKINNACEEEWEGIEISDAKNVGKMLFVYGKARIVNVKGQVADTNQQL